MCILEKITSILAFLTCLMALTFEIYLTISCIIRDKKYEEDRKEFLKHLLEKVN